MGRLFFYNAVSVEARFVIFIQVLSLLVLLVSLVCLVVALCTGFCEDIFCPQLRHFSVGVPSIPGKRKDRKPSFVDLYTTRLSSEV